MEDLIILYNLLLHTLLFHSAVAVAVAVSVASLFGEIYPPRSFRRLPKTLFLTLTLNLQWVTLFLTLNSFSSVGITHD